MAGQHLAFERNQFVDPYKSVKIALIIKENKKRMNRRDLLLNEMGISQWQLRRPEVLKGAVNITMAEHIRLVVITEQELNQRDHLLNDVLLSAEISIAHCLFIDFEQVLYLNVRQPIHYWLLSQNNAKIDRTLPLCVQALSLWQSTTLEELKQTPTAKRALWQQIQASFNADSS